MHLSKKTDLLVLLKIREIFTTLTNIYHGPFCGNILKFYVVNYTRERVPRSIFDWVLNTLMKSLNKLQAARSVKCQLV